jgi:putative CocE/NonD family hydrolase
MRWDHFDPDIADVYDDHLALGPLKNANARVLHDAVPFWNELLAHPNRDAWWVARDPRPRYRDIAPAVLVVGGWFDAEDLWGALETYGAMNRQTPRQNRVSLVMGPWSHGGWHRTDGASHGDIAFGQKTSDRYRRDVETPFFESHLRGDDSVRTPEAFVFFTGDNEWAALPAWPPSTKPQPLWLGPAGTLVTTAPSSASTARWLADPAHPVPYLDGASADIDKRYMSADQRFAARRPDVVTYRTTALLDELTLAGPVELDLWFATTGTDADVVVKLIDVWPEDTADPEPNPRGIRLGGYQQLVRGEVLRGRFRESFAVPAPFAPGAPTRVRFTLPDVAHTFRAGHRLMVQVQSSWFPLVDRNPQTFVDIAGADESDFVAQTHTLHHGGTRASALRLPVLRGRLP